MTPSNLKSQLITDSLKRFEGKFCNNHQKPVRFLRSVFYDEQDGAEEIENFLTQELSLTMQKIEEETKRQIAGWFKFPYRKGRGCEWCGGKLQMIRGRHPHEDKRKVCATCATEILESLHDNLVSFEQTASSQTTI